MTAAILRARRHTCKLPAVLTDAGNGMQAQDGSEEDCCIVIAAALIEIANIPLGGPGSQQMLSSVWPSEKTRPNND